MRRSKRIIAYLLALVVAFTFMPFNQLSQGVYADEYVKTTVMATGVFNQTSAREILTYVNDLRTKADQAWYINEDNTTRTYVTGLKPLEYDYELEQIAMQRAMEQLFMYAHKRPNDTMCDTAMIGTSFEKRGMGENLACGQITKESAFEAWAEENCNYDGQGHRRNMLRDGYTHIGMAHIKYNDVDFWVQEFSDAKGNVTEQSPFNGTKSLDVQVSSKYVYSAEPATKTVKVSVGGETQFTGSDIKMIMFGGVGDINLKVQIPNLKWSVEDTSIAQISAGKIIGVSKGATNLVANAFGRKMVIRILVGIDKDPMNKDYQYYINTNNTVVITKCNLGNKNNPIDIEIPETIDGLPVVKLDYQAFYNNDGIKSVTIPKTVKAPDLLQYVFSYCSNLEAIYVDRENPYLCSENGVLYSKDKKILYVYPCNKEGATYVVDSNTTQLDCTAFAAQKNLKNLKLKSKDTAWYSATFAEDDSLKVYYVLGGESEKSYNTYETTTAHALFKDTSSASNQIAASKIHEIKYMDMEDATNINITAYNEGESATLVDAVRKDYFFDGWFTDNTYKNAVTKITSSSKEDITLYPKWTKKDYAHYQINYELNGGSLSSESATEYVHGIGLERNEIKVPSKSGYYFETWYLDPGFTKEAFTGSFDGLSERSEGDITLYAKYSKAVYQINYHFKDDYGYSYPASYGDNPTEYNIDSPDIVFKPATRSGYTFDGWYTKSKVGGKIVETPITRVPSGSTGHLDLYAHWIYGASYTIEYNLNGGVNNPNNQSTFKSGTKVTLEEPTKEGYAFDGWYTNETFTSSKITEISSIMRDYTLYAKWKEPTKYTISYYIDGKKVVDGPNPTKFTSGVDPEFTLIEPTKEGYKFLGWYDSANKKWTKLDASVKANKVLTAKWECAHEHTIAIEGKEATALSSGLTDGVRCEDCRKIIVSQKSIKKLTATIKLSATKKTIKAKKTYTLVISKLATGDSVKTVSLSSKKYVTVKKVKTNNYKITGKKKGKTVITVKLASGKTAKCTITVK